MLTGSRNSASIYGNGDCVGNRARVPTASTVGHPPKNYLGSEDLRVMVLHVYMPLAKQRGWVGEKRKRDKL